MLPSNLLPLVSYYQPNGGSNDLDVYQRCANAVLIAFYVATREFTHDEVTDYGAMAQQLYLSYMSMKSMGTFRMIYDIWRDKPDGVQFKDFYDLLQVNEAMCADLDEYIEPLQRRFVEYFRQGGPTRHQVMLVDKRGFAEQFPLENLLTWDYDDFWDS